MRAHLYVLAQVQPGTQLPFEMGDRRVGTAVCVRVDCSFHRDDAPRTFGSSEELPALPPAVRWTAFLWSVLPLARRAD